MGVEKLTQFLKLFEIEKKVIVPDEEEPKKVINIDACWIFFKYFGVASAKYKNSADDIELPVYNGSFFKSPGVIDIEFFNSEYFDDVETIYRKVCDQILINFVRLLKQFYEHGFRPVLIWDSFVTGIRTKLVKLEKKKSGILKFNLADMVYCALVLKTTGIPTIFAEDQGEKDCVAYEHDYVYSADTDVIVLGAKVAVSEIKFDKFAGVYFIGYEIGDIYEAMSVATDRRIGLSDLKKAASHLGTDFNKNVRGIGAVKVFNMFFKDEKLEYAENINESFISFFTTEKTRKAHVTEPNIKKLTKFKHTIDSITNDIYRILQVVQDDSLIIRKKRTTTVTTTTDEEIEVESD